MYIFYIKQKPELMNHVWPTFVYVVVERWIL